MLYGFRGNFSCGIQPARGVSHIINLYIQYPLINFHLHMYLDLFDTDSSNISTCFRFLMALLYESVSPGLGTSKFTNLIG